MYLSCPSPPVSAPEVPQQPPNSRHLPHCEQRPPQHSYACAAADCLWYQGGSDVPNTAPLASVVAGSLILSDASSTLLAIDKKKRKKREDLTCFPNWYVALSRPVTSN